MSSLCCISLISMGQYAIGASFDCGKARSSMEKLICSDEKLSKLDEELDAAYKHALAISGSKSVIKQWQRDWLRSYDVTGCKDAQCLSGAFASRIELIRNVAPSGETSSKWNGRYVRFWKGREDKDIAALLLVGLSGDRFYISGSAIWRGPNAANGQVNTGEIDGIGSLKSGKATFDLDGCTGEMVLKDDRVVVEEESGCGGMNVSFVGEYRKK